jgi:hypothetical protein
MKTVNASFASGALIISFLCFTLRVSQAQVVIDSFDAGPFSLALSGPSGSVSTTAPTSDIAGGTRIVQIGSENNLVLAHSTASLQLGTVFWITIVSKMGVFRYSMEDMLRFQ